jgi:hypothetical protein
LRRRLHRRGHIDRQRQRRQLFDCYQDVEAKCVHLVKEHIEQKQVQSSQGNEKRHSAFERNRLIHFERKEICKNERAITSQLCVRSVWWRMVNPREIDAACRLHVCRRIHLIGVLTSIKKQIIGSVEPTQNINIIFEGDHRVDTQLFLSPLYLLNMNYMLRIIKFIEG